MHISTEGGLALSSLVLQSVDDINAFIDPFRTKIMRVMKNRHCPMTVKEIADEIGEVPAKVYYHVKKLEAIGVLAIQYTKEINGIVAKYYDFTTDSVSLSVPKTEDANDLLSSRMAKLYSSYFDEAKQQFYDCLNRSHSEKDYSNYFNIKEQFRISPDQLDNFTNDMAQLIKRYESHSDNAANYYFFCAMIEKESGKKPEQKKEGGQD